MVRDADLNESIKYSMECEEDVIPLLPYILQDFFEIGTKAAYVKEAVSKHRPKGGCRVLELGCGKGAVAITLAKEKDVSCVGVDAMPEFIQVAEMSAASAGLSERCRFIIDDIRSHVKSAAGYDVVVLGSIGPVLGNLEETLSKINRCLVDGGVLIIADDYPDVEVGKRIMGFVLVERLDHEIDDRRREEFDIEVQLLTSRCHELCSMNSDLESPLRRYILRQKAEYSQLKEATKDSVFVFRKAGSVTGIVSSHNAITNMTSSANW